MTPAQYFYSRMAEVGFEGVGEELQERVAALTLKQLLSLNPTFSQMRSFEFVRDLGYTRNMRDCGQTHAEVVIHVLKLNVPKVGKQ